ERGLIEAAHGWKVEKDPHGAIAKLDRLREEFPRDARVPYLKGRILSRTLLQQGAAAAAFEEALALNPDDNYTLNSLAFAYLEDGRQDEALRTIRRYVSLEPENPNARDSLGEIAWYGGDLPAAIEAFEQAMRIEPVFFSKRSIGYTQAMLGRFDESRAALAEFGESGTVRWKTTALWLRSLVDEATGRFEAAREALEAAADYAVLDDRPETVAELRMLVGELLLQRGRTAEADGWSAKAMA
ncbi:MAG: tetratricopeptide repeat protein, partial [Acidobacteria bacterium]|nr:tetratricopeptide repeat protein [Acidobacteriota bacterium]NIQ84502.1 tetratricopeptide repeat protein [Acidobacteriota bacterium]